VGVGAALVGRDWATMRDEQSKAAIIAATMARRRALKLFREVAAESALTSFFLSVAGAGVDGGEAEVGLEIAGVALQGLIEEFGSAFYVVGLSEGTAEGNLRDVEVWIGVVSVLSGR